MIIITLDDWVSRIPLASPVPVIPNVVFLFPWFGYRLVKRELDHLPLLIWSIHRVPELGDFVMNSRNGDLVADVVRHSLSLTKSI